MVDKKNDPHAAFMAANPTFKPVGVSLDGVMKKLKTAPPRKRPHLLKGDASEGPQD